MNEAGEARGAPKVTEVREALTVMETKLATKDMDIHRGWQDQIQPSLKEMKKDVKNMYSPP